MLIYSKASKQNIDNAVAKAKAIKPFVKIVDFGAFDVKGNGSTYRVTFGLKNGEFAGDCQCVAGSRGICCYHLVACATLFKQQVTERAAMAAQPKPLDRVDLSGCKGRVKEEE